MERTLRGPCPHKGRVVAVVMSYEVVESLDAPPEEVFTGLRCTERADCSGHRGPDCPIQQWGQRLMKG